MDVQAFQKQVKADGFDLNQDQLDQFDRYLKLLQEWNEKVNLTAITESEEVYLKHFYDSICLAKYVDLASSDFRLCDVGSGAGFPALPLKILFPNLRVTIVDSLRKRIDFLEVLVEALGLTGVDLYHDRAETFGQNKDFRASFDYTTARAVARMNVLAELCLPLNKLGGTFIAMKASSAPEELEEAKAAIATLGGKVREDAAFDLPEDGGTRHMIIIDKKKESPNKYPRKPGTPNKKPL
ncbi:16S rRNA (guanine(527)-N(7))-methyltransferase RsmG [Alloiococcus otitis]|uniref:16S rRNA (guanine(527)-N(7))-methyltransferase RsmG n=1 Tax=Alloiococcus otitis TaxID=1652 RepID=UPI002357C736|nr:16S rRNA (guanine(527)-N(7))-methyltransferase RsmG [Alloiococcus otitis]